MERAVADNIRSMTRLGNQVAALRAHTRLGLLVGKLGRRLLEDIVQRAADAHAGPLRAECVQIDHCR